MKSQILVRVGSMYKLIRIADVKYIRKVDKSLRFIIHNDEKQYSSRKTIKEIFELLPNYFVQVHSGYVVNLDFVTGFSKLENKVFLAKEELPLSRHFGRELLNKMKHKSFESIAIALF